MRLYNVGYPPNSADTSVTWSGWLWKGQHGNQNPQGIRVEVFYCDSTSVVVVEYRVRIKMQIEWFYLLPSCFCFSVLLSFKEKKCLYCEWLKSFKNIYSHRVHTVLCALLCDFGRLVYATAFWTVIKVHRRRNLSAGTHFIILLTSLAVHSQQRK